METFQGNEYFRNRICNYGRSKNVQKSLSHKPFNPDSESHQKFEAKLKDKITALVSNIYEILIMLRRLLVFMGMIVAVVLSFKYCEFKKEMTLQ
jgi:hypothetical protein